MCHKFTTGFLTVCSVGHRPPRGWGQVQVQLPDGERAAVAGGGGRGPPERRAPPRRHRGPAAKPGALLRPPPGLANRPSSPAWSCRGEGHTARHFPLIEKENKH